MASASLNSLPSRRERRRREIHDRIIEAALDLFRAKGFNVITALEIADAADVAEKTFYNHFPTKQHLIGEISQRTLAAMTQELIGIQGSSATTVEKLRLFCERVADEAEKSRTFTREVLFEVVRMAQVDGVGVDGHRRTHRVIQSLFDEGRVRGDVSPEVAVLSELGVAAFMGLIINWVTVPNYPLRERLHDLAEVAGELIDRRTRADEDDR